MTDGSDIILILGEWIISRLCLLRVTFATDSLRFPFCAHASIILPPAAVAFITGVSVVKPDRDLLVVDKE